jgi:5'-3' exonuclease
MHEMYNYTMKINVILDGSYICYFLLFSAYSSWQKKTGLEDDPERDISIEPEFIKAFNYKLTAKLADITKIIRFHAGNDSEILPIIFVQDCSHRNNWRIAKFPSYKIRRRTETSKPFNVGKAFGYVASVILGSSEISQTYNLIPLKSQRAEGDDLVATLIKYSNADKNLVIASDYDFLQLHSDKTMVINLFGETMSFEKFCGTKDITDARKFLLYKIILGDHADCLPHVFKNCGKKRCLKYVNDPQLLAEALKQDETAQKQFELNQSMIDMAYIPTEIEREILTDYMAAVENYKNNRII